MSHKQLLNELKETICANPLDLIKLTITVRKFRNLCAIDEKCHSILGSDISLLEDISKLMDSLLLLPSSEEQMVCLRLIAQFLGNLTVVNLVNQNNVFTHCFRIIKKLMLIGDGKLSLFCSMLIYNVLLGHPEIRSQLLVEGELIKEILKEESEFASFIYEELLLKHGEIEALYTNASNDQRLILFATIKENKSKDIPETCVQFLVGNFKRQSDKILKIVSEYVNEIQPLEICLMLETLGTLSSESRYLTILQADKSLFINCAFLLRSIHETGKSGENCFSSIQRITAGIPDKNLQSSNPAYAFKVDLIRLLGNLCWKHKELQDLVRELECIPILLECCNIDENNPFITQWSVLAIRNLCENNQQNQNVIAGLSQRGVVPSPVLNELGFTLHSDEGKDIKLVPLPR